MQEVNPKRHLVQNPKQDLDNKLVSSNQAMGKKIQKIRKGLRMTQEEVAERVGISATYLGFIEQGRYMPSLEVLEKIAKVLKVKSSDILHF